MTPFAPVADTACAPSRTGLCIGIPQSIHRSFKAACVIQGVTMTSVVCSLVRAWTDETDKPYTAVLDTDSAVSLYVDMPPLLRREFKAACGLQGVSMTQVVCSLVRDWSERPSGPSAI